MGSLQFDFCKFVSSLRLASPQPIFLSVSHSKKPVAVGESKSVERPTCHFDDRLILEKKEIRTFLLFFINDVIFLHEISDGRQLAVLLTGLPGLLPIFAGLEEETGTRVLLAIRQQ